MAEQGLLWSGDRSDDPARAFGRVTDRDELLHPEAAMPGDTLTETYAYMFYVPEERICCLVYIWFHPNLGVVTAGLGAWIGHKYSMLAAEMMDVRAFMSAAKLGNGADLRFDNGLSVVIEEPFKSMRIRYDDLARGNALDVHITDFSPPVVRGSEKHFDQATYNRGTLRLRGRDYTIDGYGMRDRSWGELRPEDLLSVPPYTWMTGTFPDAGISWHLAAHDDPALNPDWLGSLSVDPAHLVHDSWLYRDGRLSRLVSASKITRRDPATCRPMKHEIVFTDDRGEEYRIEGLITSSIPWVGWPNQTTHICLTEWRWNGMTGYGDTQEVHWGDFQYALRGDSRP